MIRARCTINRIILLAICQLLISLAVFAHEEHAKNIEYLNKLISEDPENPELYFVRGSQYQSHEDFEEARSDYFTVRSLKSSHKLVELNLAKLYLDHDLLDSALLFINVHIQKIPISEKGIKCRADIYHSQKKYDLASLDYLKVISVSQDQTIENFLALTNNYKASGETDKIRQTLKEAMKELGALIPLQSELINLEASLGNWSIAHEIIDDIIKEMKRKESWFVRKAQLYQAEGKMDPAKLLYIKAKKELEILNPGKRNTDYVKTLEEEINKNITLLTHSK